MLFFHGNAGNISQRINYLSMFKRLGYNTLLFDYRGYGQSSGVPSESGTYLDAQAGWRYLTEIQNISPERIILFGESLGGAVAAWLAAREKPGLLVLASTFTSVPNLAAQIYPFLPVRWITRFHYNTLESLQSVEGALGAESAADSVSREQILMLIESEIAELPLRQREAFLLRYWDEFDVAETAEVMGCSEGSVKTHCSRAVHSLARALRAKGITP